MNFRLSSTLLSSFALFCILSPFLEGCTNAPRKKAPEPKDEAKLPLLEPSKRKPAQPGRCQTVVGSRTLSLRAEVEPGSDKGEPNPPELGNAVESSGGFAVGVLRGASQTRAQVEWFDGKGRERRVDLGVVHGAVEPPWLLPVADDLIVIVSDNDAGHSTLRVAKISDIAGKSKVTWGPTIQRPRSEREEFSVAAQLNTAKDEGRARVILAWDAPERSSLKSRIRVLSFFVDTMQSLEMERVLSPADDDAVSPLLLPRKGGFWFIWTTYGMPTERAGQHFADENNLIEEAPRTLRVQLLDEELRSQATPLHLSEEDTHVLAFDAASVADDSLFVAFRATSHGRILGTRAIGTRVVSVDGAQQHGVVEEGSLGPGAPLLLPAENSSPWLVSRGEEDEVLLGSVGPEGHVTNFSEEPTLDGYIPLLRRGEQLLTMHPRGLDLELSLFACRLSSTAVPPSEPLRNKNP